jgi:hypothetical protein
MKTAKQGRKSSRARMPVMEMGFQIQSRRGEDMRMLSK